MNFLLITIVMIKMCQLSLSKMKMTEEFLVMLELGYEQFIKEYQYNTRGFSESLLGLF